MSRRMHKKGFLDDIVDDFYAAVFLLLAFLIAFLAFSIGQKETYTNYKTSLGDIYNQRAVNLYFKYPLGNDQLIDYMDNQEIREKLIPVTAKPYFDDYLGRQNGWMLRVDFPHDNPESIKVKSSTSASGRRTAATVILPSRAGLINVILFQDKHVDIILLTTGNPMLTFYYWLFG